MAKYNLIRVRDADMFIRHLNGETNRAIAKVYNITDARVHQINASMFRILRHPLYTRTVPYPFPREKAPHLWKACFPGTDSTLFTLQRKRLRPEEKEADKTYWLKLLELYEKDTGITVMREIAAMPRCACGSTWRPVHMAGVPMNCRLCGESVPEVSSPDLSLPFIKN